MKNQVKTRHGNIIEVGELSAEGKFLIENKDEIKKRKPSDFFAFTLSFQFVSNKGLDEFGSPRKFGRLMVRNILRKGEEVYPHELYFYYGLKTIDKVLSDRRFTFTEEEVVLD